MRISSWVSVPSLSASMSASKLPSTPLLLTIAQGSTRVMKMELTPTHNLKVAGTHVFHIKKTPANDVGHLFLHPFLQAMIERLKRPQFGLKITK
jgi:hypothetical protein